jgi:hypothetical protein
VNEKQTQRMGELAAKAIDGTWTANEVRSLGLEARMAAKLIPQLQAQAVHVVDGVKADAEKWRAAQAADALDDATLHAIYWEAADHVHGGTPESKGRQAIIDHVRAHDAAKRQAELVEAIKEAPSADTCSLTIDDPGLYSIHIGTEPDGSPRVTVNGVTFARVAEPDLFSTQVYEIAGADAFKAPEEVVLRLREMREELDEYERLRVESETVQTPESLAAVRREIVDGEYLKIGDTVERIGTDDQGVVVAFLHDQPYMMPILIEWPDKSRTNARPEHLRIVQRAGTQVSPAPAVDTLGCESTKTGEPRPGEVRSSELSPHEIAFARAAGVFRVDSGSFGFVPWGWLRSMRPSTAAAIVADGTDKPKPLPEIGDVWTWQGEPDTPLHTCTVTEEVGHRNWRAKCDLDRCGVFAMVPDDPEDWARWTFVRHASKQPSHITAFLAACSNPAKGIDVSAKDDSVATAASVRKLAAVVETLVKESYR